jgi:hypothetical protein
MGGIARITDSEHGAISILCIAIGGWETQF